MNEVSLREDRAPFMYKRNADQISEGSQHAALPRPPLYHQESVPNHNASSRMEQLKTAFSVHLQCRNFRSLCGTVVNHPRVQLAMVALISLNAVLMGVATFDFVTENQSVAEIFEVVDQTFLIIFTIELGLHLIHLGLKLFLDGWLVFDFTVILLSWSFATMQVIRAFRILRSLRLLTRVKVLKNLISALLSVLPKLAAICTLLLLVFYIFAVMMTQLFKNLYEDHLTDEDYFGRLDLSLFTLFQMMTLDGWSDVAHQVMNVYPWAWMPFVAFVTATGFIIVNLMIAVICDAVSSLHDDVKAKIHGTFDEDEDYSVSDNGANVRQQFEQIDGQFDELQRVQEQTMHRLEYLAHKLRARNNARLQESVVVA
jgi:Ion transport protein